MKFSPPSRRSRIFFTAAMVAMSFFSSCLHAKEDAARLSLQSAEGEEIKVIRFSEGAAVVNPKANSVSVDQPVKAGQWSTASVTFKTAVDADIRLRLSASWTKTDEMWVLIDNVKAEGIQVENPDFEKTGSSAPTGWKFLEAGGKRAAHLQDASAAASGTGFIKVSHGCPAIQTVHVPKDTEVTITFSFRSIL